MAIVDIGPSSSGLISLIREALPADRRHEAVWAALQMTPDYAVNPCDTPLGCRYPLPADRDFLANLLGMLLTPVGVQGVPDGVAQTIPPLIDGIYRMRADDRPGQEPQRYARGRDPEVDAALGRRGLNLSEKPLWWEAVDLLFEAGEFDAAARAQRYAVPTLRDCLTVVRGAEVQSLVGDARYGSGQESVTSAVIRILNAQSGNWPVLFGPTVFDLRNAADRVGGPVCAGAPGEPGERQADCGHVPDGALCADARLVDRRGNAGRGAGEVPRLSRSSHPGDFGGAEEGCPGRVPPDARGRGGQGAGGPGRAGSPETACEADPGLAGVRGFRGRAHKAGERILGARRRGREDGV